jgi:flagellar basal-body rod protein FlgG
VAIKGQGFFQIQLPDGTTGYTRDGAFQVDANGQLVTNAGYVVQPGITIPPTPPASPSPPTAPSTSRCRGRPRRRQVGQLQLASFVNPAGLDPRGGNLFAETGASGTPNAGAPGSDGLGSLQQGFVEGSNVNVVEELVSMIATQRAYELNSKAIQTSDQMLQRLGQL